MELMRAALEKRNRPTTFAAIGGILAIILGLAFIAVSAVTAAGLVFVGVLLVALAGTASRWESLGVKWPGGSLDAKLAREEHGEEFKEAAKSAPDSALAAVIPLLRQDVASDVLDVPEQYAGKRLIDTDLAWLRQDLNVTVFAVRRPGGGERWAGGGVISTLPLTAGSELAVLGERADIDAARRRLAE